MTYKGTEGKRVTMHSDTPTNTPSTNPHYTPTASQQPHLSGTVTAIGVLGYNEAESAASTEVLVAATTPASAATVPGVHRCVASTPSVG